MEDVKFKRAFDRWQRRPSRLERIKQWVFAASYQVRRRTNFRWRAILRTLVTAAVPASAPLLTYYFSKAPSIELLQGVYWSLAIFGLSIVATIVNNLLVRKESSAPVEEMLMRVGEVIQHSRYGAVPPGEKQQALRACLSIIEVYVRSITGAKPDEIGVALALYVGSSTSQLMINVRNNGSKRRTGNKFNGVFNLGHHACMLGSDPRVILDLRDFGQNACKSPTGSKNSYRSIFIVPLVAERDGKERPIGYVSIDSTMPYEFYGNRANVMAVDLPMVIDQIKKLL